MTTMRGWDEIACEYPGMGRHVLIIHVMIGLPWTRSERDNEDGMWDKAQAVEPLVPPANSRPYALR